MRISELYGPVLQGEGALLGERMPFVRTASCNLSCSWCDSAYTWKAGYEYTDMTPAEIVAKIQELIQRDGRACDWVSLTGGEPTIQYEAGELVQLLQQHHFSVIVETNGLRNAKWFGLDNVLVSCSPKLSGSGQDTPARRLRIGRLVSSRRAQPPDRTQYKFVIATPQDLADLEPYCADVGISLRSGAARSRVYVQPDGYVQPIEKYLEALQWLQESAPAGVLVTPQVHRLVHGPNARAV